MSDLPYHDAATAGQQLLKLGLVTEAQLEEAWEELGGKGGEGKPLINVLERKGYLTPYLSGKFLKGDTDGYILGGYKLLYRIASGTFGRVFRAQDVQTGRVVAVKVLRRRHSENQQRIEQFEREGRVGMRLQHPNIVEILNVGIDPKSRQ